MTAASAPLAYPSSDRLGAQPQCAWVDGALDGAVRRLEAAQRDVLVRRSDAGSPRLAVAAAQLPRLARVGLGVGRMPSTMVRDVLLAVATVVVDDGVLAPSLRIGGLVGGVAARRRSSHRGPAGGSASGRAPGAKLGRGIADTLALVAGTGCAILATPLNMAVLVSAALGTLAGAALGILAAAAAWLLLPASVAAGLPRGLGSVAALQHAQGLMDDVRMGQRPPEAGPPTPAELRARARVYAEAQAQLDALVVDRGAAGRLEHAVQAAPRRSACLGLPPLRHGDVAALIALQHEHAARHRALLAQIDALDERDDDALEFFDALEHQPV